MTSEHVRAVLTGRIPGYDLGALIGEGGMGRVFAARDERGRSVAIKLMHRRLLRTPDAVERFRREASAMLRVRHANVVAALAMGVGSTGLPYLVMECVAGPSLSCVLEQQAPLDLSRVARIGADVVTGLEALHAQGIVHRDLKPDNVLLSNSDRVADQAKISDFGLVAWTEQLSQVERSLDLTPHGKTMGTPRYVAPELFGGASGRDPRVDLYAVGVMLFEMLAGTSPFPADDLPSLIDQSLHDAIPPLRAFRRDVPEGLEQVVRCALAKNPQNRFPDATTMKEALLQVRASLKNVS